MTEWHPDDDRWHDKWIEVLAKRKEETDKVTSEDSQGEPNG